MGNFMINNIPMQIVTATGTINAKASISPNRMEMKPDGTEIEDYVKVIVNEEIRTPDNTTYFKDLVVEVLQEQGLI
jgi:pyrrolidone-carboxylate peptidase